VRFILLESIQEDNIIKQICKELGMTQKELSIFFGVTPKAVSDWAVNRYELPKNFHLIIDLIKTKRDFESLKRILNIS